MRKSVLYLLNMYLSSSDYKNEDWYIVLSDDDKEFVNNLDNAVSRGIVQGIKDYKEGGTDL